MQLKKILLLAAVGAAYAAPAETIVERSAKAEAEAAPEPGAPLLPGLGGLADSLNGVVGNVVPTSLPAPLASALAITPGGTTLIARISQVVELPQTLVEGILEEFLARNPLTDYSTIISNLAAQFKAAPTTVEYIVQGLLTNGQSLGSPVGPSIPL